MDTHQKDNNIVSYLGKILNFIFLKSNIAESKTKFLQKYVVNKAVNECIKKNPALGKEIENRVVGISNMLSHISSSRNNNLVKKAIKESEKFFPLNEKKLLINVVSNRAKKILDLAVNEKQAHIITKTIKEKGLF